MKLHELKVSIKFLIIASNAFVFHIHTLMNISLRQSIGGFDSTGNDEPDLILYIISKKLSSLLILLIWVTAVFHVSSAAKCFRKFSNCGFILSFYPTHTNYP